MAKSPTEIVQEQEAKDLLQDMKETKAVQEEAADKSLPGDRIATARVEDDERPVEEDPELLARLQDPHGQQQRGNVKTAVFLDAYGNRVRAAV